MGGRGQCSEGLVNSRSTENVEIKVFPLARTRTPVLDRDVEEIRGRINVADTGEASAAP